MLWKGLFELVGWVQLENTGRVGEAGGCWSGGRTMRRLDKWVYWQKSGRDRVYLEKTGKVGIPEEDYLAIKGISAEDWCV